MSPSPKSRKSLNFPSYLANILKYLVILSVVQDCTVLYSAEYQYPYKYSDFFKLGSDDAPCPLDRQYPAHTVYYRHTQYFQDGTGSVRLWRTCLLVTLYFRIHHKVLVTDLYNSGKNIHKCRLFWLRCLWPHERHLNVKISFRTMKCTLGVFEEFLCDFEEGK